MADFLSLISAIPSLMQAFGGSSNPYGQQQKQLADQQSQYASALGNPSNPLYQQLYGQYQNQNRQNLGQSIAEAQAQNRANVALGRTPLIGGERGNETLFRNIMQGYQQGDVNATNETQKALQSALSGSSYAGKAYQDATPGAARASAQQLSGFQGIQDLLNGYNKQQSAPNVAQPGYGTQSTNQASSIDDLLNKFRNQQQQPQGYTF